MNTYAIGGFDQNNKFTPIIDIVAAKTLKEVKERFSDRIWNYWVMNIKTGRRHIVIRPTLTKKETEQ